MKVYKIIKKGRKWFQAVDEKGYKAQIEINEHSENWEVGKTYKFPCSIEVEQYKQHKKINVFPSGSGKVIEFKSPADNKENEFNRWLGYVKENAETKGYLYEKGVEKIRELRPGDETEELITKYKNIANFVQGKVWLGYIKNTIQEKEDWYLKGEKVVFGKYGLLLEAGDEEKANELLEELNILKDKLSEIEKKKQAEKGYELYSPDGFNTGQVVRLKRQDMPEFLYVKDVKEHYYAEDGYSFGVGAESGYVYTAICRQATEEEVTVFKAEEEKRLQKRKAIRKLDRIKQEIQKRGERSEGLNIVEGKRMFDTQNIHGGGDWLVITEKDVWYIQNNGRDGDDWSRNNVKTVGAGAIGWRVDFKEEIINELKEIEVIVSSYER